MVAKVEEPILRYQSKVNSTVVHCIYLVDFDLLKPRKKLNDTIINFYLSYLLDNISNRNDFFIFSSYFFTKLKNSGYSAVKHFTNKINIFDKEYLIFPINEK